MAGLLLTCLVVAIHFSAPRGLAAQNRVLELDGNGSYVELPPDIFRDLTEATVEVWAKWDSFRNYSRLVEFGAPWQSMSLFNHDRTADLRFNLYPQFARDDRSLTYHIRANRLLRTNEWIHLAAVSGPGGMRLYANGVLVGTHTNSACLAAITATQTSLFGRGLSRNPTDQDFRGQMDEIRVWNHQRSEAQIREFMCRRLTGQETGLAALWNFDEGTAKDSGPGNHDGKFMGQARVMHPELPAAALLVSGEYIPSAPTVAAPVVIQAPTTSSSANAIGWWIAGTLTAIFVLLAWLVLSLKRREATSSVTLAGQAPLRLREAETARPSNPDAKADADLQSLALAELTEFAKQSLVQGLYTQRNALLETQRQAQLEIVQLEARLGALKLPERIQAYEKRIAELEKELTTRTGEVRELINTTLVLMRDKLQQEKGQEHGDSRLN